MNKAFERQPKLLAKLNEEFDKIKDDSDDDETSKTEDNENTEENKTAKTLHLLYAASKVRIYKIADKIASNQVPFDLNLCKKSEVEIPVAESWDFRLGDRVKIKYSFPDFRSIQSRTLGWNAKLRTIYDCEAIVTRRWSQFENSVTLYTPSRLFTSSLYAGLLEKIPDSESKEKDEFATQWHVNEYVTTIKDPKVVELMQRRLDTIPSRYLGRKGRIIAVTRVAIIVTFNERTSYDINSYLLMRCADQTPLEISPRVHQKGFVLGEKVHVSANVREVIENQKSNGGWSENMTKIIGKEVTIVHICKDQKLGVQYSTGESWVVNADSLHSSTSIPKVSNIKSTDFVPGDIVKVEVKRNMRALLQKKNVPMIFMDYLRSTAEVKLIDDDFDYSIRYNCNQNVAAYAHTIRKATPNEITQHVQVKSLVEDIKVGSKVVLDVGPVNYVTSVLRESMASHDIVHALTTPATLVGFASDKRAVIEFEGGKRYKVKKKFLTVPEKFNMQGTFDGMDFSTAKEILESVGNCIQQMLQQDDSSDNEANASPVKVLSMSFGFPPTIDLRVQSIDVTTEKICELLITMYGRDVEVGLEDSFCIKGLESFDREIQVNLVFNEDLYMVRAGPAALVLPPHMKKECTDKKTEASKAIEECSTISPGAGPIHDAPQEKDEQEEESLEHQFARPSSVDQFRYICLRDRTLSTRNVYIPFFIGEEPLQATVTSRNNVDVLRRNSEISGNKVNIFNIASVENFNNLN